MDNKVLIDLIIKDIHEIGSLTHNFKKHAKIPPIYIELALSKIKNLYAQMQLLDKNNEELINIDKLADLYPDENPESKKLLDLDIEAEIEEQQEELKQTPSPEKQAQSSQPKAEIEAKETKTADKPAEEKTKKQELSEYEKVLKMREQEYLRTQLKYTPITDINAAIGINDKIWFVKALFEGSIEKYKQTVDILNAMKYLEQAFDYIDRNFKWNPNDKTVKKFMQVIYRRFA